jgi:exonuclease I
MKTFYWYDYETFGLSPRVQRIAQFAGIRTDENLNILDEHMFYCKPTNDSLPSPEACAVTGITPQLCEKKGLIEHEFIKKINMEFSVPDTCIVGYNSIAFDDEFTRHALFRNFLDPYAWHWQNGNTRWDIIDVVRLCYALKNNSSLKWADNSNPGIFSLVNVEMGTIGKISETVVLATLRDENGSEFTVANSWFDHFEQTYSDCKKLVGQKIRYSTTPPHSPQEWFAEILKPDGIFTPSFKLDKLSKANRIEHSNAHDALADVRATIGIAKIIKDNQPQLFDYALSLRNKKEVSKKIELLTPMLHTSAFYPAKFSCTKLTTALAYHPDYADRVIVFNLEQDPSVILELEINELRTLIFTKNSDLPKNVIRFSLTELVFNKSPMFVPNVYKLESTVIEQLQIDMDKCLQHLAYIKNNQRLIEEKIQSIYKKDSDREPTIDVDQSLYDNFISNKDRKICDEIQHLSVDKMSYFKPNFEDRRLLKLFLNFKARNYPKLLSEDEQEEWFEIVQSRVQNGENGFLSFDSFENSLDNLKNSNPEKSKLWQDLEAYVQTFL